MPEIGPNGRWVVVRDIKADPGGSMAIVDSDMYRAPCMAHNPGVPVYNKMELSMLKGLPHSAEFFRFAQKVKRAFPTATVVETINKTEGNHGK
jgi:hypothetical protein